MVSENACDCHFHVFGDPRVVPPHAAASYVPEEARLEDYLARVESLGFTRHVLIQPSVYGADNSLHLHALETLGERGRAVVVLDENTCVHQLETFHTLGVRGVRINALFPGVNPLTTIQRLRETMRALRWHVQLLIDVGTLDQWKEPLRDLDLPLVFDHFGHWNIRAAPGGAGIAFLLELLREGRAWLKLSAPYRMAAGGPPYEVLRSFTHEVVQSNSERLLWGSDWPHPAAPESVAPLEQTLQLFKEWLDDAELEEQILVLNPAHLYDWR